MPFTIRPSHRFPVPCAVTYNAGPFRCQGTVWNLSYYRPAILRGSALASKSNPLVDRHAPECATDRRA